MISERYSKAMAETLHYLKGVRKEDVDKIPKSFINYLKENADTEYKYDFDYTLPSKDLRLMDETRGLISMICLNYWCETEEQKQKLINRLNENEKKYQEELREKYNPDNLFKVDNDRNIEKENDENSQMIEFKKPNIFMRILDKIEKLLRNLKL